MRNFSLALIFICAAALFAYALKSGGAKIDRIGRGTHKDRCFAQSEQKEITLRTANRHGEEFALMLEKIGRKHGRLTEENGC